jgi:hypothetical protein
MEGLEPTSDLKTSLRQGLQNLWGVTEATVAEQQTLFELAQHSLRAPGLEDLAGWQYERYFKATAEYLEAIGDAAGVEWVPSLKGRPARPHVVPRRATIRLARRQGHTGGPRRDRRLRRVVRKTRPAAHSRSASASPPSLRGERPETLRNTPSLNLQLHAQTVAGDPPRHSPAKTLGRLRVVVTLCG